MRKLSWLLALMLAPWVSQASPRPTPKIERNIVVLGAPASGKGTLAKELQEKYGIVHIATGDIVRAEVKAGTPFGKKIESYMLSGKLLPDSELGPFYEILKGKLAAAKDGFILDGVPRSLQQCIDLERIMKELGRKITEVRLLEVDRQTLMDRVTTRLTCSKKECGMIYNEKTRPPKKPGVCDKCGNPLVKRKDDTKEVLEVRLAEYEKAIGPIKDFYIKAGLLTK